MKVRKVVNKLTPEPHKAQAIQDSVVSLIFLLLPDVAQYGILQAFYIYSAAWCCCAIMDKTLPVTAWLNQAQAIAYRVNEMEITCPRKE